MLQVNIVNCPAVPVAMMRHVGPYDELSQVFDMLSGWVDQNNVQAIRWIGIYWDNPDETPANQLRSAACVEVPNNYQIPPSIGAPITLEQIPAGPFATCRYVGPYEGLDKVWTEFTAQIEGPLGRQISGSIPAYEVYVNDASDTPPQNLITELYMPLV
ncbi:MAG: GyrI-like domain-containing protein [Armatimonadetes bacterium]|nr:GyrI-like domain-containing protein [Armatimonadota bacterium]